MGHPFTNFKNSCAENALGGTTILIVDDSRMQRRIIASSLKRRGYTVLEAGSGGEAMALCRGTQVDMVVSDWMMPDLDGLAFCDLFRNLERETYGYFILLTSKTDKADVAQGLDGGADDVLIKPVAGDELLARIRAGERVIKMERELREKNRLVNATLDRLSALYDEIDRDLLEASRLQQSLVRGRERHYGPAEISLFLRPNGHVGGDLVGSFRINDSKIGVFCIDVSGHGVASALLTARFAAYLAGTIPEQNVAICYDETGACIPERPSRVAARLNRIFIDEVDTDLYLTMIIAHFDTQTGDLVMAQCGHPSPFLQRSDGTVMPFGTGGMPIGLFEDATYDDVAIRLQAGDRVLFFSDGFTDWPTEQSVIVGEEVLAEAMALDRGTRGEAIFDKLVEGIQKIAPTARPADDMSAVMLYFEGASVDRTARSPSLAKATAASAGLIQTSA